MAGCMKNIGAKAIMEHKNETSKNESADLNNKKAISSYGYIDCHFRSGIFYCHWY